MAQGGDDAGREAVPLAAAREPRPAHRPRDGRRVEQVGRKFPGRRGGPRTRRRDHARERAAGRLDRRRAVGAAQPAQRGRPQVELTPVSRDGRSETADANARQGWKKTNFLWRGSRWSLKPQPGFWAPALTDRNSPSWATPCPRGAKPLRVQWINTGKAEGRGGPRRGVAPGRRDRGHKGKPMTFATPEAFQMHVRLNRRVGETLKLSVFAGRRTAGRGGPARRVTRRTPVTENRQTLQLPAYAREAPYLMSTAAAVTAGPRAASR